MDKTQDRYVIEWTSSEVDDSGIRQFDVIVCNDADPCYIVGVDSGYVGLTIDELENIIRTDDEYSELERTRLLKQVTKIKSGMVQK